MQKIFSSKIVLSVLALAALGIGGYFAFFNSSPTYQLVAVERGSIIESVSLTGNTAPAESVSLTFGASGVIARTYSGLGKVVRAGQVLAELNTSDLLAQLHQAQANVAAQEAKLRETEANVAAQQAKLAGLQAGARPEDVAASQAALDKAEQDLANMYTGIADTSVDAYAKANDAVRIQIDALFSNAESQTPQLTYITADSQAEIIAESKRFASTVALDAWQNRLGNIGQSPAGLEAFLQDQISYLATMRALLNSLSTTLDVGPSLTASALGTYKASVSTALTEVNTAAKNLNTISQNLASQKLTVSQAQAQLDLKQAGSLPTDISAQEAQVAQARSSVTAQQAQIAQARASVESAAAKLENARVIAPIGGTVTQFDAKVGEQASQGTTLISIMSDAGYEAHAGVSETDVGKVSVGDKVAMSLDAFPGETFPGSVFYIAPAETNTQGVVSYAIKISFDAPDPRIKSGLTANITIETARRDDVLILPQYAILQNDEGTFVQVLDDDKTVKELPVTLGIQDQDGNVEVRSGVDVGTEVVNIGLKKE